MKKLNAHEAEWVSSETVALESVLSNMDKLRNFKLGDYLILFNLNITEMKKEPIYNSYGVQVKYKVVYVSEIGIPYLQFVNSKGHPTGNLVSPFGGAFGEDSGQDKYTYECSEPRFELDPDYVDSILLQNEHGYDPATATRDKRTVFNQITEHNKTNKVDTFELSEIVKVFDAASVGDTLWISSKNGLRVDVVEKVPFQHKLHSRYMHGRPNMVTLLTVTDRKGKQMKIGPSHFMRRSLYKAQPRSYNELKDKNQ